MTIPVITPPTLDAATPRYEVPDPSLCPLRDYGGPAGEGLVGQRNDTSIKAAFANSPIYKSATVSFYNAARNTFSTYNGENVSGRLEMYRRDFAPNPAAGVEYEAVRDKTMIADYLRGGRGNPATPFSPNIASPIVTEGALFIGASQITNAVSGIDVAVLATKLAELNPINDNYKNLDSAGHKNDIGGVRRFTLGIGSTIGILRSPRTL